MGQIKRQLKHLEPDVTKDKLNNICSKCRNLPDVYYGGDSSKFVSPDNLADSAVVSKGVEVKMWEWYSGSSSLSSYLRDQKVEHLPPIDYRYGWNLSRREHQIQLLDAVITVGVGSLFASPNCAPWGNHTRSLPKAQLEQKRAEETSTLRFLTVACFSRYC